MKIISSDGNIIPPSHTHTPHFITIGALVQTGISQSTSWEHSVGRELVRWGLYCGLLCTFCNSCAALPVNVMWVMLFTVQGLEKALEHLIEFLDAGSLWCVPPISDPAEMGFTWQAGLGTFPLGNVVAKGSFIKVQRLRPFSLQCSWLVTQTFRPYFLSLFLFYLSLHLSFSPSILTTGCCLFLLR